MEKRTRVFLIFVNLILLYYWIVTTNFSLDFIIFLFILALTVTVLIIVVTEIYNKLKEREERKQP
ncbi:MAG: hypothetical protein ACW981_17570 [Candidatus Hodarchaeales archaeon]